MFNLLRNCIFVLVIMAAAPALATPVWLQIDGTVTGVDPLLVSEFSVDDSVQIILTYDSDASRSGGAVNTSEYNGALSYLSGNVGGDYFFDYDDGGPFERPLKLGDGVGMNISFGNFSGDSVSFWGSVEGLVVNGITPYYSMFYLNNPANDSFLPVSPSSYVEPELSELMNFSPFTEGGGLLTFLTGEGDSEATVVYQLDSVQEIAPVPEPATMLLFGMGLLGLAGVNRRKK